MGLAMIYVELGKNDRALSHIEAGVGIDLNSLPNGKPSLSSYYGALDIFYEHKKTMSIFQVDQNNINQTLTTQRRNIRPSRSPRTGVIYYRCPWCHLYVWIYTPFAFCKGSPCFQCLRRVFALRPPRMSSYMAHYINYLIAYDRWCYTTHETDLYLFAHQLRQNYLKMTGDIDFMNIRIK